MSQQRHWLGSAQYLFIPVIVRNIAGYSAPPANFREYVQRRLYHDPDPINGYDRSLCSYLADISHGRATLNARVSDPVTIDGLPDTSITLAAINAQPNAHLYNYLAVVLPTTSTPAQRAMHQPGQVEFVPPRSPNRTLARSRFMWDAPTGTWAMEIIHNVSMIGDYYNGVDRMLEFEQMDYAAATHPTTYTKLVAGWVDEHTVPWHEAIGREEYALHAVGLPHPPNDGRVAAVRIRAPGSNRYLVVEARLKSDRWERGFAAARVPPELVPYNYSGIPSECVLVYEFSPETDPWPRPDPNGPWPPIQLRAVLSAGDTFTHFDSSTATPGATNSATGVGRSRTITVQRSIVAGFVIQVATDRRPRIPDHDDEGPPGGQPP